MYCPKCGYKLMCGCPTCKKQIPKNHKPKKWDISGNIISCPNCGLKKHCDWWQNLEMEIWK